MDMLRDSKRASSCLLAWLLRRLLSNWSQLVAKCFKEPGPLKVVEVEEEFGRKENSNTLGRLPPGCCWSLGPARWTVASDGRKYVFIGQHMCVWAREIGDCLLRG